jgi:voltage-gated potassium channel
MTDTSESVTYGPVEQLERALVPWTRALWFAFLIVVAIILPHSPNREPLEHLHFVRPMLIPLALLWGLFLGEFMLFAVLYRKRRTWRQHLWALTGALIPPLRLSVRPVFAPDMIWLPRKGWRKTGRDLARELEQSFHAPMIVVALLILPILALEMLWADQIATNFALMTAVEVAVVFIWLIFAIEFFTMISVHDDKLAYCKAHWIDLLIIILPLIAFLRVLRVARLARLTKLERMTRVYRLRGLFFRIMRALVLINMLARINDRFAQKRIASLHKQLAALDERSRLIREEISEIEEALARRHTEKKPIAAEQGAQD